MIPCSSGSWAGETSLTPIVASAILSEANSCTQQQHHRHDHDHAGAGAGGEQDADEHHVDEPEQEHRQQHPGLQAGVFAERSSAVAMAVIVADAGSRCPKLMSPAAPRSVADP